MKNERTVWPSRTHRYRTGCGWIYISILRDPDDENKVCAIFTDLGKAGGCAQAQTEAVSRITTRALRAGDDPAGIAGSLRGMGCHQPIHDDEKLITSCADAIGRALQADINMETKEADDNPTVVEGGE